MQSLSPQSVQKSLSEAAALCDARGKRLTPIRAQVLALMLQDGRSLKAYENSFKDGQDVMVLRPDSDFFKYMKSPNGNAAAK